MTFLEDGEQKIIKWSHL